MFRITAVRHLFLPFFLADVYHSVIFWRQFLMIGKVDPFVELKYRKIWILALNYHLRKSDFILMIIKVRANLVEWHITGLLTCVAHQIRFAAGFAFPN